MELTDLFNEIVNTIKEEEMPNEWLNSTYLPFKDLEIDKRGSFGERFFQRIFTNSKFGRGLEYKDSDQDIWDLKVNGLKLEIKTASFNVSTKKFQNAGIKQLNNEYDGILFLGIAPNHLYVKMVKYEDIQFHKLHNRKKASTGAGFKWDFKAEEMILITTTDDVINEFEKVFNVK